MDRFGLPLTSIVNKTLGWNSAWRLAKELLQDHSSHLFASVAGWAYVPSDAEQSAYMLFEGYANSKRGKNQPAKAIKRPWDRPRLGAEPTTLSKESKARRARLAAIRP